MLEHYIINKKGVVRKEKDLLTWAKWFQNAPERIIKKTLVATSKGKYDVSTVFLGLNHNFGHKGKPILFETMVFDKKISVSRGMKMGSGTLKPMRYHKSLEGYTNRYKTYKEALKGHQNIVNKVNKL